MGRWKNTGFRTKLFVSLMVLLTLPLVQTVTRIIHEKPLQGAIVMPDDPKLTARGWFSGSWQPKKEKYLNDAFGFRNLFVRINNQMALSLFHEVHAFSVIFGKDNYLYEENYIKAWYGADFIGSDSIARQVDKLKFIQDELWKRYRKNLIVVFSAGKGSFYPEYFPASIHFRKGPTNYDTYIRKADSAGLKIIDFNRWFVDHKYTSPYPLYPKYGIHWSIYGASLVTDSLLKYIDRLRGIEMPSITWNRIRIRKAQKDDYDMGYGLNLLFKLRRQKMAYPVLEYGTDENKTKPSVLVVADSFYWILFKLGITRSFSTSDFWFYNREIYHDVAGPPEPVSGVSLKDQLARHDVIILMATEANLPRLGWGFIGEAYDSVKSMD
jgi:hypothetical protein